MKIQLPEKQLHGKIKLAEGGVGAVETMRPSAGLGTQEGIGLWIERWKLKKQTKEILTQQS